MGKCRMPLSGTNGARMARLVLELISMATLPPTPGVKIATAAAADDSDLADVPSRLSVSPPPLHMEPAEGREC